MKQPFYYPVGQEFGQGTAGWLLYFSMLGASAGKIPVPGPDISDLAPELNDVGAGLSWDYPWKHLLMASPWAQACPGVVTGSPVGALGGRV